jgi:uncharacterized protein (TIGR02300 family)
VANPKWGTKRICQSCGAKFYDLQKSPILCPSCGTQFDPEALLKSRRPRAAKAEPVAKPKKPKPAPAAAESEEPEADFAIDDEEADAAVGETEEDDFIEDTEDLGEDDMADVVVEEEEDEA